MMVECQSPRPPVATTSTSHCPRSRTVLEMLPPATRRSVMPAKRIGLVGQLGQGFGRGPVQRGGGLGRVPRSQPGATRGDLSQQQQRSWPKPGQGGKTQRQRATPRPPSRRYHHCPSTTRIAKPRGLDPALLLYPTTWDRWTQAAVNQMTNVMSTTTPPPGQSITTTTITTKGPAHQATTRCHQTPHAPSFHQPPNHKQSTRYRYGFPAQHSLQINSTTISPTAS